MKHIQYTYTHAFAQNIPFPYYCVVIMHTKSRESTTKKNENSRYNYNIQHILHNKQTGPWKGNPIARKILKIYRIKRKSL